ncbi:THO complex subunit 7 [Chamberlinius hualienensis]
MTDDEVIRRKLLVDGDGVGDDRRLTTMTKTFIKWFASDDNEEDTRLVYEHMLATVAQVETTIVKSKFTNAMHQEELKNYELLSQDIEKSISEAYNKIESCKKDLQNAKRVRKNKQEYDALATVIEQHPDRLETTEKLKKINEELTVLKTRKGVLEEKLNLRRKQFAVLSNSVYELGLLLEDDQSGDEDASKEEKMDTN